MELPTLNLKELEELAIEEAMKRTGSKVAKAAKLLGIGRATLYRRLERKCNSGRPPDTHEEEQ
jgi:two-component system response regulator HydG